jgi:hypothetical protein
LDSGLDRDHISTFRKTCQRDNELRRAKKLYYHLSRDRKRDFSRPDKARFAVAMGLIAAKKRNEVRRRKILFVAGGGEKTVSMILLKNIIKRNNI